MKRYLLLTICGLVLTITACGPDPTPIAAPIIVEPMSPQEMQRRLDAITNTAAAVATQNATATIAAQATLDAAARNAAAMYTEAAARQTLNAAALAPALTAGAATNAAAISTQTAGQQATRESISATQIATDGQHQRDVDTAWSAAWIIIVTLATVAACLTILFLGRAVAARTKSAYAQQTFELIFDDGKNLLGWREWKPERGWEVHLFNSGLALGAPESIDETMTRHYWREAVRNTARAASIIGSWSVNALSTREGGAGIASEDAVIDCRNIAASLGAVVDYKSTRGFDWAGGWNYLRLYDALDGVDFPLPLHNDGAPKQPPSVDLSRCNATQRNATTQQRTPTIKSPMKRKQTTPSPNG